jgi:hypothetical protein
MPGTLVSPLAKSVSLLSGRLDALEGQFHSTDAGRPHRPVATGAPSENLTAF